MVRRLSRLACLAVACVLGAALPLEAQRPGPIPPLRPSEDPTAPPTLEVSGFRTFASWVDDAEVLEPGVAVVSLALTRWHWALGRGTGLPNLFGAVGHVQVPVGSMRLYGSAGYFSVGSSFAGASLEAPVGGRLVLVGTISQSFARNSDTLADEFGVSTQRTDASGGAWIVASPSVYLFGVIGRTISSADLNSMTLSANAGIAVFFGRRSAQP